MAGWGMQRQQFGEQKHWMLDHAGSNVGTISTSGGLKSFLYLPMVVTHAARTSTLFHAETQVAAMQ